MRRVRRNRGSPRTVANGVDFVHAMLVREGIEFRVESVEHFEEIRGFDHGRHLGEANDVSEEDRYALVRLRHHSLPVLQSLRHVLWKHLLEVHQKLAMMLPRMCTRQWTGPVQASCLSERTQSLPSIRPSAGSESQCAQPAAIKRRTYEESWIMPTKIHFRN
jgi:hypothetical protein